MASVPPLSMRLIALAAKARGLGRSASLLQPRFRLAAYPIGGLRLALKLTDLVNRPVRPVDLDYPTLTVTEYRAENWLCGRHAHTGRRSDQKSDDSECLKSQKAGPNRTHSQAAD
jgi:hypothetical protein